MFSRHHLNSIAYPLKLQYRCVGYLSLACCQCEILRMGPTCVLHCSGVAPANQTKERPIRKPFREFWFFSEFGVFFLEEQGEFTKTPQIRDSPCFSRKKHSEFTNTLQIREPACESAFLWFGLPGRLLNCIWDKQCV